MPNQASHLKLRWQDADRFISAVHSQNHVVGLTHNFYKYPARFSPDFVASSIDIFSNPGDLVVDPFVGGGTTLVEARASGRLGIGSDISTLATFISRAKTKIYSNAELTFVGAWCLNLASGINLRKQSEAGEWKDKGYTKNLECTQTWMMRKAIEQALQEVVKIDCPRTQSLARCIILRTAQWALDGRKQLPGINLFREKLGKFSKETIDGAQDFARRVRKIDRSVKSNGRRRTVCLNARAEELASYLSSKKRVPPKLIVTSPPYPGVHVLYHRWQVRGGKETPAPFWIANQLDGAGESHYLMHARRKGLNRYYTGISRSFSGLRRVMNKDSVLVQLVAFSNPSTELPRYLDVMRKCGLKEYILSEHLDSDDGRLWRNVPGRRWHANSKGALGSDKEVVLIHKSN